MKAEQLRKSILQLAIQGKLVPQNPADEPASVLLERIRAEKQRLIKEGKIKKDKGDSVIFKGDDNCYYEKTGSEVKNITDEIPFDIPDSWCWTTIEKITFSVGSKENQIQTSQILKNGLIPVVSQSKNIIDGFSNLVEKRITKLPVIMFGDHTKVVKLIDFPFVIGADGTKFFSPVLINDKFLYYLLVYTAINLPSRGYARHYVLLKKEYLPIPPLAEQERIVAEIEKFEPLIAEYDKLEQQASKLDGEIYDKLKKSILQYAIQGKLVPQDSNDEPASVLLERIRTEKKAKLGKKYVESYIYKGDDNCYYEHINGKNIDITEILPIDIPDNWAWVKLGDICFVTKLAGFEYTKYIAPNLTTAGVPIFKGKNVQDGEIIYKFEGYIPESISDMLERSQVRKKCILTPYVGTIGNLGIHNRNGHYHLGSNVGKIELLPYNITSEEYIVLYLKSIYGYGELTKNKKATAQESISIEAIREVYIPIPPLAEQKRIVEKINEIFVKL